MQYLSTLSIKSRFILILLTMSLGSALVIGVLSWSTAQNALDQAIFTQLTSVQDLKGYQIENYFEDIYSQTRTLAENRMVVNAMENFVLGYHEALNRSLTAEQHQQLTDHYEKNFLPQLAKNLDDPPLTIVYRPQRLVASYYQYHYIANNSFPQERKDEMVLAPEDGTTYKVFHSAYHPLLNNLRRELGFEDIFLVDLETSNIVYSVLKKTEFATSLQEGPYRESGLGTLVSRISEAPERDKVVIMDYRPYAPSYNKPATFVGAPIFDQNEVIGILVIQLSADELNGKLTNSGNWEKYGLGESGTTYLVGPDRLMRSTSRFYDENSEEYLQALKRAGFSDYTLNNIRSQETTILLQPVYTEPVDRALAGDKDATIARNYLGISTISAYAPLSIPGLEWVILSEIDVSEAFMPMHTLQRTLLIWGIGFMLAFAFLSILLSNYFLRPIDILSSGIRQARSGQEDVHIAVETNDEFGKLAQNINMIIDSIQSQKEIVVEKNRENEELRLNILPAPILERVENGEQIADQLQQVSVLFVHLQGFAQLAMVQSAEESAALLEQFTKAMDETASRHEVERVKTVGETYIAACGLIDVQLDHVSRSVDFAIDVLRTAQQITSGHADTLSVQIGIHVGPVMSGVIQSEKFSFEFWGETVDIARTLCRVAEQNSILMTEAVQQRLDSQLNLSPHELLRYGDRDLPIYLLKIGPAHNPAHNTGAI